MAIHRMRAAMRARASIGSASISNDEERERHVLVGADRRQDLHPALFEIDADALRAEPLLELMAVDLGRDQSHRVHRAPEEEAERGIVPQPAEEERDPEGDDRRHQRALSAGSPDELELD